MDNHDKLWVYAGRPHYFAYRLKEFQDEGEYMELLDIKSKIKGCYTTATNVLNSLKEQKTKQITEQIKTPTKQIPPSSLREGVGVRLL